VHRQLSFAAVLVLTLTLTAVSASAAGRPPLPKAGQFGNPLLAPALEEQNAGNFVRSPSRGDLIARKTRTKYCKAGPHDFFYGETPGGRAFSATLDVTRFCHAGNRVSEISISTDHRLYGIYNFFMKFDHQSVQRGYYNWHRLGNYSGYFVRAKYYFLYCYEPTKNACTKTYILYLRIFVHADGTSSTFRTYRG
jgi:hypothetical protein